MRRQPDPASPRTVEGYFTGDYQGLAAMGTRFCALTILGQPEARKGGTDPFSVSFGP